MLDNDERGTMEELCNVANNQPVFAGKTISSKTIRACLDREWVMRYNGEYILTKSGEDIIGVFEMMGDYVKFKPNGCKHSYGNYKNGCGNCGAGNDKNCRIK